MPPNTSSSQLASIPRLYKSVVAPIPAWLLLLVARADPLASTVGCSWVRVDRIVARASRTREIAVRTSRLPVTARRTSAVSCSSPKVSHHRDRLSASASGGTSADHAVGAVGTGACLLYTSDAADER